MKSYNSPHVAKQFRIKPTSDSWINVYVWDDLDTMNEIVMRHHPAVTWHPDTDFTERFVGCFLVRPWKISEEGILKTRCLGEIHLGRVTNLVVAHELQHFISNWERSVNWDEGYDSYEDIAWMVGILHDQIWEELNG